MARRAVRLLCLAIVLAAVLFHPDAAVEGKDRRKPEGVVCSYRPSCTCEVKEVDVAANSHDNKVLEIGEIIGNEKNFCKKVEDDVQVIKEDDVQLVFEDERWRSDEKRRKKIKDGLLEAMKHYKIDLIEYIYCRRPSIQQLKEFTCDDSPHSAEDNESKFIRKIKNIGDKVKLYLPSLIGNLLQKEKPPNQEKACKKLKSFLDVKFNMTF